MLLTGFNTAGFSVLFIFASFVVMLARRVAGVST